MRALILTTEECLLSDVQARNPELSREDLEQVFADYLGATKTLWLNSGIAGDDTHGHVDDLARFVIRTLWWWLAKTIGPTKTTSR